MKSIAFLSIAHFISYSKKSKVLQGLRIDGLSFPQKKVIAMAAIFW